MKSILLLFNDNILMKILILIKLFQTCFIIEFSFFKFYFKDSSEISRRFKFEFFFEKIFHEIIKNLNYD